MDPIPEKYETQKEVEAKALHFRNHLVVDI